MLPGRGGKWTLEVGDLDRIEEAATSWSGKKVKAPR